jgi:hypothetical protein
MAEYVKWRFTKMRAGVTMALFGLLAGLGIRAADQSPAAPKAVAIDRTASTHLPTNSIGSTQIKNHSLLITDFKDHQVASYKSEIALKGEIKTIQASFKSLSNTLTKIEIADKTLVTTDAANQTYLKIADATNEWMKITDANSEFLKIDGTAGNAQKIDGLDASQLIQGHGAVFTNNVVVGATAAPLVTVPGLVSVTTNMVTSQPGALVPAVNIVNVSGQVLLVNGGTDVKGAEDTQTIPVGGSLLPAVQFQADGSVKTLQILVQGGTQVTTLTLSSFASPTQGGAPTLVAQAMAGSS